MSNRYPFPSPEEYFGFKPGTDRHMIRWDKLCEYYRLLDEKSDRLKYTEVGKSSEGNPFLILYVSSEDNIKNLEKYRLMNLRLADPRDLTDQEEEKLVADGKAVCFQSYSLHSNETGGAQSVPLILYTLLTAESGDLYEALQNVIFIISPCSEPDGEIIFTDWYNEYLGTRFEGVCSPYLRHNLAGHSNNRDALREILCESRYLNDILVRNWKPQAFQDHHHQYPWENRMSIGQSSNPIFEAACPLAHRETAFYGASMAEDLTSAGRKGVVCCDERYNAFPISTFYGNALLHNTAGLLTENADVEIATPIYLHPEQRTLMLRPSSNCPDPWEGGEWHLSDIVEQMYLASLSLVVTLSKNKERALRNTVRKAKMQIERGNASEVKAYLLPPYQDDASTLELFLYILYSQRVEYSVLSKDAVVEGVLYPKGTIVVPTGQPNYAVVDALLGENNYPVGNFNTRPDGYIKVTDTSSISLAISMGLHSVPAHERIDAAVLEAYTPCEKIPVYPLSASRNDSYRFVNGENKKGKSVYRDSDGNFYGAPGEGLRKIRFGKVGLLKKSATWNEEEGYTRSLLRAYDFDYRTILDKEIRDGGVPDDVDVLIIPGDRADTLLCGDKAPEDKPPRYHSGLGTSGGKALCEFVERGGRLIAWEDSCRYVNRIFGLGLRDTIAGLGDKDYSTNLAALRIGVSEDSDLTLGMPKRSTVLHNSGPILLPSDLKHRFHDIARFPKSDILRNGIAQGYERLADTPCVLRTSVGKGDIVLFTFNPEFRMQCDGTFKLLFNATYFM